MMAHELNETDLRRVICEAGRSAVLKGRKIWGGPNDNDMREEFLSALIAIELHAALQKPVRTELEYTAIYKLLGHKISDDVIAKVGSFRADVVLGEMTDGKFVPAVIIEIKKFAEGASVANILADLHKGDEINLVSDIKIYAGVMVCETQMGGLEQRESRLETALSDNITFSEATPALGKERRWSFACLQRPVSLGVT